MKVREIWWLHIAYSLLVAMVIYLGLRKLGNVLVYCISIVFLIILWLLCIWVDRNYPER